METGRVVNGSDLELVVDIPTLNDAPYDARGGNWELELWVYSSKRVKVRHTIENGFESIGEVDANADVTDEGIELYIKASKNPMGKGDMKAQMTIYADNPKFEDRGHVGRARFVGRAFSRDADHDGTDFFKIGATRRKQTCGNAVLFTHKAEQKMLRAHVGMPQLAGEIQRGGEYVLCFLCKAVGCHMITLFFLKFSYIL